MNECVCVRVCICACVCVCACKVYNHHLSLSLSPSLTHTVPRSLARHGTSSPIQDSRGGERCWGARREGSGGGEVIGRRSLARSPPSAHPTSLPPSLPPSHRPCPLALPACLPACLPPPFSEVLGCGKKRQMGRQIYVPGIAYNIYNII